MISLKNTLKAITTSIKALSVDYIVEQGTSGIWTYRKWNSGIAECWGTASKNETGTYGNYLCLCQSYPSGLFSEDPILLASGGASGNAYAYGGYAKSLSVITADVYVYTAGSKPAWVYIYAIGKWK